MNFAVSKRDFRWPCFSQDA